MAAALLFQSLGRVPGVQVFQRGGFDGDSHRNALGNLDVLSQQIIDQGLQAIGRAAAFFAQVLRYILIQVNRYPHFFGGHIKPALFGI
jgi:hypothetical protein